MQTTPLNVVPFMDNRNKLSTITKNPILQNTFVSLQEAHLDVDSKGSLFKETSLWNSPSIPIPIADSTLKGLVDKGNKVVGDLHTEGVFSFFQQLSWKYYLIHHNLFKCFQIRHWVKANLRAKFLDIAEEIPLWRDSC